MLKVNPGEDGYLNNWIRSCDSCQAAACAVFCHTDSAYLCDVCDKRVHESNLAALSHHRVWICTACETAPATVTCSADAASLCNECDVQIHSANPLARRHVRVPVTPIGLTCSTSSNHWDDQVAATMFYTENEIAAPAVEPNHEIDEHETDSWLLLEPENTDNQTMSGFTYGEQLDEYMDICTEPYGQERCIDRQQIRGANYQEGGGKDSVVPVQTLKNMNQPLQQQKIQLYSNHMGSKASFSNFSSRVPMVLMNAGIPRSETFSNPLVLTAQQLTSMMNREEKVMRYREKRKARKFEKKIRYASRKAYSETRHRIKGRFARKTDMGVDDNQMFSKEDYGFGYGVVPTI